LERERLAAHVRDLERHDQELLGLLRHDDADHDRRVTVTEDFLADAGAEHYFADPDADLMQKTLLIRVPLVGAEKRLR
jgi:hypothetical protein